MSRRTKSRGSLTTPKTAFKRLFVASSDSSEPRPSSPRSPENSVGGACGRAQAAAGAAKITANPMPCDRGDPPGSYSPQDSGEVRSQPCEPLGSPSAPQPSGQPAMSPLQQSTCSPTDAAHEHCTPQLPSVAPPAAPSLDFAETSGVPLKNGNSVGVLLGTPLPPRHSSKTSGLEQVTPDWTLPPVQSSGEDSMGSWRSDLPASSLPAPTSCLPQQSVSHLELDPALRSFLSALPTKADLQALIPTKADFEAFTTRIESAYKKDLAEVKQSISSLSSKVSTAEQAHSDLLHRVSLLESAHSDSQYQLSELVFHLDDLDNRGRRNNVRIRGLPEATGTPDLKATVRDIFNRYLDNPPNEFLEIDRAHRSLGPRPPDSSRPRDVICRVHFFAVKEAIMQQAWIKGPLDFDGATIQLFPDLSRRTLQMRRLLKPLLAAIRSSGATYRWGFPFHLIIRKQDHSFLLKAPADLPALFSFLEMDPIDVPDWSLPRLDLALNGTPLRVRPPRATGNPSDRSSGRTHRAARNTLQRRWPTASSLAQTEL